MISRLNPVRINIEFSEKTYRLGDTVSLRVDITADTDVTVRKARIGMECQTRYTKRRLGLSKKDAVNRGGPDMILLGAAPRMITESVEVEQSDTYDGPAFLTNQRLQAGSHHSSGIQLELPPELGRNGASAQSMTRPIFSWRVVVTADVRLARDVTESAPIDIALPGSQTD